MAKDYIQVLQFSDTHLFADSQGALCGQNTEASLDAVLEHAKKEKWPPDLILVTGDISQDRSDSSYSKFKETFSKLKVPVYCCPGNHDDPEKMNSFFIDGSVQVGRSLLWDAWQIVMLNSLIPEKTGGHLNKEELLFLEDSLKRHPQKNVLVCLHHSPLLVDSNWIDAMVLDNAPDFFRIIDKFPHIRGLLWGHIHQEYEGKHNGIKLMGSPSTSVQFRPKSHVFGFDDKEPGYRWLHLYNDGKIDSGVHRADGFPVSVDLDATGY